MTSMNPPLHRRINSKQRSASMKKVSFSEYSQVFVVADLLQIKSSQVWYSPDELHMLKAMQLRSIIKTRVQLSPLMQRRIIADASSIVDNAEIAGLEKHLSDKITLEYKRRRREVLHAVKAEQRWQRQVLRSPDPYRLAMVSCHHSRWAMDQARIAALLVQEDVMPSSNSSKPASR